MQITRAPVASLSSFSLPDSVPAMNDDLVDAACRASSSAQDLWRQLDGCAASGKVCSSHEVDGFIKRARDDDNHAVVLAWFAQHRSGVFAHGSEHKLGKFLAKVEWSALRLELEQLFDKIHEQQVEAQKKQELEDERLADAIKRSDERVAERKAAELKAESGTRAERSAALEKAAEAASVDKARLVEASEAAVNDELGAGGKIKLSDVELGTLGLLKKGFANR
ncbi:MAG TPA: hypothetical protein VGO62_20185 [Myxococcota bacterium]|jgi:hypothetical protein